MKSYTDYKDFDDSFVTSIPSHWSFNKLVRVCYMKGRIGWQGLKQSEFVEDDSLPYLITGMNFKNGKINWKEVYHISEERYVEAPEIQLKKGDVLMTKDGTIGKLLFIDDLPGKASLNSHLLVLRPLNNAFQTRYFYYQLLSEHFNNHIELNKSGTTFFGLSQEAMGLFKIILPPLEEQTQIAQYLDHKTSQIDKLITDKEKLIELLNEERTAIINHAVTKGLNPDVPMKDSGIDWLGKVPEHWKVGKLKLFCDLITDGSHHSPPSLETGKRYISVKDVKDDSIDFENCKYISNEEFLILERNGCRPHKGDILLTKDGTIGRACLVDDDNDFVILSSLAIIRAKKIAFDSSYLKEFLVSQINVEQMLSNLQGSALTRITLTIINNLYVVAPPKDQQIELMLYINAERQKINALISKIQQEIQLLKEYKTALISEVVTGKVDVRDEVIVESTELVS